ncbi:hypothetical protein CLV58_101163 [Spirosoma oryzae]|uniref:Uncharacterized protein n=1 Tax=Spirosoma oryzae TaxID=1469603 RepID=A0A2T0TN65_9BACT|nr:hypothetical protein [Spirosoma oryzae]PRY47097.1 hypothetical protein CLV58_101163 [Spirosoma oryzae]
MRQHNQYLAKVQEELSIYQKYLIDETFELTQTQLDVYDRIEFARNQLREGYSDSQVLTTLKRSQHIQDRRAREILALAYAVFGEVRQTRSKDGIKYLYAEMFKDAYKKAMEAEDFRAAALLLKEAAKIDGAYSEEKTNNADAYKRPTKITIKTKSVMIGAPAPAEKNEVETVTYELEK